MPISSVGRTSKRGVTLIEMVVVVTIMGLIVGISFPSVASGLDSIRIASAAGSVAGFMNSAVNTAERRQVAVELVISPKEGLISLYTNEPGFKRELKLPEGIALQAVLPRDEDEPADTPRTLVLLPGATVPGIGIQIGNAHGSRRIVRLDPMTGFPRVESLDAGK